MHQPVIVENMPGANGSLAAAQVARATPDGYTLMLAVDSNLVINPSLYNNLNYDPFRDFAPISIIAKLHMVLVANPKVPANTVQELIAYAKAHPNKLNYASIGFGTAMHMGMELFKYDTHTEINQVSYRGTAPAMTDVVAGIVDVMFTGPPSAKAMSEGGKLKLLAVASPQRMPLMPDVPTVNEAGRPRFRDGELVRPAGAGEDAEGDYRAAVERGAEGGRRPEVHQQDVGAGSRHRRQHAGRDAGDDEKRHEEVERGHQGDGYRRFRSEEKMGEGITGWRLHVGVIFPTPVPPRPIREWYQVVPEGVDITTVSLSIQQLTDDNMEDALTGMERAAKQLSNFDVDVIFQSGVPPVVARGTPGFANELQDRLEQASGLPCITDMAGVIDAMHASKLRTVAMATPFRQFINDRLVKYLATEQITVSHNKALGIERNTEIRRLPIPVEYQTARKAFLEAPGKPDGLYIPCGGWGSMHNIEPLEQDLDTTVVTWMNVMIWSAMRRGKVTGPINGFGKLLASL